MKGRKINLMVKAQSSIICCILLACWNCRCCDDWCANIYSVRSCTFNMLLCDAKVARERRGRYITHDSWWSLSLSSSITNPLSYFRYHAGKSNHICHLASCSFAPLLAFLPSLSLVLSRCESLSISYHITMVRYIVQYARQAIAARKRFWDIL